MLTKDVFIAFGQSTRFGYPKMQRNSENYQQEHCIMLAQKTLRAVEYKLSIFSTTERASRMFHSWNYFGSKDLLY
jgi:hypothetical protein